MLRLQVCSIHLVKSFERASCQPIFSLTRTADSDVKSSSNQNCNLIYHGRPSYTSSQTGTSTSSFSPIYSYAFQKHACLYSTGSGPSSKIKDSQFHTPVNLIPWQQPKRSFLSAISVNGFNDYELGRKNFKIDVPEYFNFASDVVDDWARKEETGERNLKVPAFWWINNEGNELKWSFRDLQAKSKKVANLLMSSCQVKPGDRVMVILPRIPEWWLVNVACMRLGAVLLPGTTQLRTGDIRDRLHRSGAMCIITNEELAALVDEAAAGCNSLQYKVLVPDKNKIGAERSGWLNFNALYESASEEHECVQMKSDDPMTIFFTSGTTGKPKMSEHSQASYGLGHITTGRLWLDISSSDIVWTLADTGWAKVAYNLFGAWVQGACIFTEYSGKFSAVRILEVLNDYPITTFCGPPTAYTHLVQEDVSKYNLRSVRDFVAAGEHLNPEVNYAWKNATGSFIREGYGQTETTLTAGTYRCIELKPGSLGKAAPGYDVAIVDDDGNELPRGTEGNIGIRVKPITPVGLFMRYVDDPERTSAAFRGDYYLPGDRASMDEEGYIWMVGRSDDIISSAGYRIGPFEVESALLEHPAVAEAAAVSSPDKVRGEVVKAFIVLSEGYREKDEESLIQELQNHVKNTTAPYKYPRKIEFVDSLPKTISNKVRRVELRQREWSNVLNQE